MRKKSDTNIGRTLSYILRHNPAEFDLSMDDHGWIPVDSIISAVGINHDDFFRIVGSDRKQRFTLSEDEASVRAAQGHSIPVNLNLKTVVPGSHLYHGTSTDHIDSILKTGLLKINRNHVHLTDSIQTAIENSNRWDNPLVLNIDAISMHNFGLKFFQSENGVFLTDYVPTNFLSINK